MAQFHADIDIEDDTEHDVVSIESDESLDFDDLFDEDWDQEDADDDTEPIVASPSLTSASGLVWTKEAPSLAGRQPQRNVFHENCGFSHGLHPQSRLEAFQIFSYQIIEETLRHTNKVGKILARNNRFQWKMVTSEEIKAFLGLHFLADAFKAQHRDERELFGLANGIPLWRAAMSQKRFAQIKCALRFDNPFRRDKNDQLAPVRYIFELFNSALLNAYKPGPFLTVDEMLIEFHGRVGFKQYTPTKPGKFGIKAYFIVDAESTVPLKMIVYIGANTLHENLQNSPFSEAVVKELSSQYLNKGRNITTNNYFTSVALGNWLLEKRTTLFGTLQMNRREIPPDAKSTANRQRGDSVHYYSNHNTMCSYWDKGIKPVILLSTMHHGQQNTMRP